MIFGYLIDKARKMLYNLLCDIKLTKKQIHKIKNGGTIW